MYICLCNGYTDRDITFAVQEGGATCADSAYKVLGHDFNCGTCRDCAQCVVDEALEGVAPRDNGPKNTGPKNTGPKNTGPKNTGPDILPDPILIAAE